MKKIMSFICSLSILAIMTIGININTKAAAAINIQMLTQPAQEYKSGDRIKFDVTTNYPGKVEYRVMLWNGITKKTSELWPNEPGYYYKKWQPAGTTKFTIQWSVTGMEPGAYSLTVLVRKVGSKVAYEGTVKTNTVWVRPKVDMKYISDGTEVRVKMVNVNISSFDLRNKAEQSGKPYFGGYHVTMNDGGFKDIHRNLMYVSSREKLPHIYVNDKDYVILNGGISVPEVYESKINVYEELGLFRTPGPHHYECYLYEVFYDVKNDTYYLANEIYFPDISGEAKILDNTAQEVPKYVAVVVQAADY